MDGVSKKPPVLDCLEEQDFDEEKNDYIIRRNKQKYTICVTYFFLSILNIQPAAWT